MSLFAKPNPSDQFELSAIKAMELAASRYVDAVSLAQGIPSFRTPKRVIQYAQEKISAGLCDKYSLTIGLTQLREELSLALETEGLKFDPESEILVTAGSIEGITATLLAFTTPGDEVILPSPSYTSYLGALSIAGCTPRYMALDEENNFDFRIANFEKCITPKSRVLLYCSPNNPTGTIFSEQKTRELIRLALKHNLLILIDEVYKDFYYVDEPHFTPMRIPEARSHIIRACSFSKAYAMTGWRVGFVHGDRERIARIVKFHDAMVTCAPVPAQYAAIGALKYGETFLQEFKAEFKKRRNYCIHRLDDLSRFMDYQVPRATYFVFPRIKDVVPLAGDSRKLAYDILDKVQVATVPGISFGPSGESHLRINFGREMQDLEQGFDRLAAYFHSSPDKRQPLPPKHALPSLEPPSRTRQTSLSGTVARRLLAWSSRNYLKSNAMTVVGIAGIKGKTIVKRTLVNLLKKGFKTRGNVLSYNTEVGLPLSILGLSVPLTTSAKLKFPAQLLYKGAFSSEDTDLLVLEYGIRSKADARTLLGIARPDWLIISGIEADPFLDYAAICQGIDHLASNVRQDRLVWVRDDAYARQLPALCGAGVGIEDSQLSRGRLVTTSGTYECRKEYVGLSAARGLVLAVELAEQLGISKQIIADFLLTP